MMAFDFKKGLLKLGEGVWAYIQPDGSWGLNNAGLVTDKGASLLVDTLYDLDLTREMLAAMKEKAGVSSFDRLVNTHDNGDHWFGNTAADASEIIASKACAEAMAAFPPTVMADIMEGAPGMGEMGQFFLQCFGRYRYGGIEAAFPTRTFEGSLGLDVGDLSVDLIEVGPCHTSGDVIVHIPERHIIFAADILFVCGHQVMWAGPVANYTRAIETILSFEPEYIVPGHGPVTDAVGAEAVKTYWQYYEAEARKRYDAGMPAFEAAKDIPAGPYADYGDPERIVLNVNVLYKEFAGDPEPVSPVEQFAAMARWHA
jgi:cyclase